MALAPSSSPTGKKAARRGWEGWLTLFASVVSIVAVIWTGASALVVSILVVSLGAIGVKFIAQAKRTGARGRSLVLCLVLFFGANSMSMILGFALRDVILAGKATGTSGGQVSQTPDGLGEATAAGGLSSESPPQSSAQPKSGDLNTGPRTQVTRDVIVTVTHIGNERCAEGGACSYIELEISNPNERSLILEDRAGLDLSVIDAAGVTHHGDLGYGKKCIYKNFLSGEQRIPLRFCLLESLNSGSKAMEIRFQDWISRQVYVVSGIPSRIA